MGIAGSGERDDLVHAYVERLETALAAATHRRDIEEEKARLAGAGVAELERRLEGLRGQLEKLGAERQKLREERDRERAEAEREPERHAAEAESKREKELAEAENRREKELVEAERRLAEAEREHERRLAEVEREHERRLAETERELSEARALLEAREGELERSLAAAREAGQDLEAIRERLGESEKELAVRDRDLAARVRELGQAGEELIARERELELAGERLAERQGELDAASTLLEAQGAELARARGDVRDALEQVRDSERERDQARGRLEVRERHLKTAQLGVESRDRRLEVAEGRLGSRDAELAKRDAELQRLRATARNRERSLALAEARLEKAQQRAEHFKGSLVEIRSGRAYRLMRILWRLRRPFRRAPKNGDATPDPPAAADDSDPAQVPAPASPPPALATSSRYSGATRQAGERLRVASILDEMSAACFAPECDLAPLALDGWAAQLDERAPDLLLVESAWNGNGGEWQYRIAEYPRKDLVGLPALRALLDGCRERGIPTAFWNKEDPVHFERFAEAASLFDHVFTTDARCVERYRALPGGERTVTPLPFAAQPRIHNPAAAVPERSASPCFAGAWYRDRHPDRRRSLAGLLDAARPYGLVIYDRSFGGDDGAFGFPERFAPHILGKLPYERILDVYKSHRVFLNANSVADSPTMCSRRVFELAACDTAILSTPGAALAALLGEGTVAEAGDEGSAAAALEQLLGDDAERRRRTRAARRAVFAAHTYGERLATIAETAGLDASSLRREPFAAPGAPPNGHPWQLQLQPGTALAEPALADLAAAATFAEADAIGAHPASNGDAAIEHRPVDSLDPRALLLSRDLIASRGQPAGSPEQIQAQLRQWSDEGVRLYAADADLLAA